MKKNILLLFLIASVPYLNAQVGINTTTPNPSSALDITSDKLGVLIPRVSLTSANDTTTVINASSGKYENGLLVYNTTTAGGLTPGFYYWQGTQWTRINDSGIITEPWQIQGTTDPATSNTDNIYQTGSVAIGKNAVTSYTDPNNNTTTTAKLDVNGAIRGGMTGTVNGGAIGTNSIAVGTNLIASGNGSAAFGTSASATGNSSLAIGSSSRTTAAGTASFAMGSGTQATNAYSIATGLNAVASADHAIAIGDSAKASSIYAISIGTKTNSSANYSTAIGSGAIATNHYSTSIGLGTQALGRYSFTVGHNALAKNEGGIAIGDSVQAKGLNSIAFGKYSIGGGDYTISIGLRTNASAHYSSAIGHDAIGRGQYSMAIGNNVTAATYYETALGRFNAITGGDTTAWNLTLPLLQIGNGQSDSQRSNALTILKNGNVALGMDNSQTTINGKAVPTEQLDVMQGNVRIRQLPTQAGGGTTDKMVVVDNTGVLKSMAIPTGGSGGGSASGTWATAVGLGSSASAMQAVAIGYGASASGNNAVAIGAGATTSQNNSFILGNDQMNVGIRTSTPTEALDVNGNIKTSGTVTSNGTVLTSDIRYKKDLQKLQEILPLLEKLNGYTYFFKTDEFKDKNFSDKQQIGMIAQEVEKVFPELVSTDAQGYKSLNYAQFTAVLLEAVKELNSKVSALEVRQTNTEQEINSIKQQIINLKQ